ncbi:YugN family protein [Paenisporosarcina sp. TG20]|uniref:YugN family protein n=1 Tax=Paenisporosarcina sp. TG20 TaxID=1211706 RepID=UPI0002D5085C|nr:YugN family protein [Paenisporosarcina sp. TG20]
MIELNSSLKGKRFEKGHLEEFLTSQGFTIGGGWEYDHAYFDYVFQKAPYYDVLRIPVLVKSGDFEQPSAKLEFGVPFLLRHCYQYGLDDEKDALFGIGAGTLNQFQKPIDKDAPISEKLVVRGVELLKSIENNLQ